MFSNLWESTKWSAHLFFRAGYALGLLWVALADWLKGFSLIDAWVFKWFFPRAGLFIVGYLVTPLPPSILFLLMFVPLRLYAGILFLSFMGALVNVV